MDLTLRLVALNITIIKIFILVIPAKWFLSTNAKYFNSSIYILRLQ